MRISRAWSIGLVLGGFTFLLVVLLSAGLNAASVPLPPPNPSVTTTGPMPFDLEGG